MIRKSSRLPEEQDFNVSLLKDELYVMSEIACLDQMA